MIAFEELLRRLFFDEDTDRATECSDYSDTESANESRGFAYPYQ